jgi:hypothetical protein
MNVGHLVVGVGVVMAWACGGSGSTPAGAPIEDVAIAAAPVSASTVRLGAKLGIGFTGNVLGELEPCG